MENTFINKNSFDKRVQESTNIKEKYTDRIPIIVEKHHTCNLPEIDKCKYLVPKDMTMSQFIFVIRKRIKLNSNQALFITINHSLVAANQSIGDIYEDKQNTQP